MKNILVNLKNLVSAKRQEALPEPSSRPPEGPPIPTPQSAIRNRQGGNKTCELASDPQTNPPRVNLRSNPAHSKAADPSESSSSSGATDHSTSVASPRMSCGPSPLSPLSSVKASNRSPNGKVAQLPAAIRESVNQWINDGIHLEKIAQKLGQLGHPGFTHHNISTW